jgi:hypothetical protein
MDSVDGSHCVTDTATVRYPVALVVMNGESGREER